MRRQAYRRLAGAARAAAALALALPALPAPARDIRSAVVKIFVTQQREDYQLPWQSGPMQGGTGSGFVIAQRRILTNAHLVSDARFIQVQREDDARRVRACVDFIGHDCDLATLTVDDPSFLDDASMVRFAADLPQPNDEVTVVGYPLGGNRLSVTRGVVSRIDYSTYAHSGIDQHLVMQVDAAINPGNSGGPVFFKGYVVGVAFQGLSWAQNIGYAIPLPVVQHFLRDIEDGRYHGYPELGIQFLDTRNAAFKRSLQLPDPRHGVAVSYVDPFGAALGRLQGGDALLAIDGRPIAEDGTVKLNGDTVLFAELLERKQWGEAVVIDVWRQGVRQAVAVPLTNPPDPFVYRNLYDQRPRYLIVGGLVFSPLTREYLRTVERQQSDPDVQQLFYYSEYAKPDGWHRDRDEFVVLIRRLAHPVNTYADDFLNGIVEEVNGRRVRGLQDVRRALQSAPDGFHVFRFAGTEDLLVLDAAEAAAADPRIRAAYGVSAAENLKE